MGNRFLYPSSATHKGLAGCSITSSKSTIAVFSSVPLDNTADKGVRGTCRPTDPSLSAARSRGFPCSGDRRAHIGTVAFSHLGQDFSHGWLIGREGFPRHSLESPTVDQHLSGCADKTQYFLMNREFHRFRTHGVPPL
jgi:hypothetical protein